jgi:4-hydroxyphenylpyruvate dioxygenase
LIDNSVPPHPAYSQQQAQKFIIDHGIGARAIGIQVSDAQVAYEKCVENGGRGVLAPHVLVDKETGKTMTISEVSVQDDLVYRFVSGDFEGPFLPNYAKVHSPDINYGLTRIDHCVTNVPKLFDTVDYLIGMVGFHEFSEFTAEDVGTVDSGLNSMVSTDKFISTSILSII